MAELTEKNAPSKNDVTPVQFKLACDHTHKGEPFKKGKQITVRKEQGERMQKANLGQIVNG